MWAMLTSSNAPHYRIFAQNRPLGPVVDGNTFATAAYEAYAPGEVPLSNL